VFAASHNYVGKPIIETGILRLTFDESNQDLTAERWDDGTSSYSSVSLGSSSWELFDLDVISIGFAEVYAQVEFRDTNQSPTAFYRLDLRMQRGLENGLWELPQNEGAPIPNGLRTLLDPIASNRDRDASPTKTVTARREVRL